jgi:hypothetical protein
VKHIKSPSGLWCGAPDGALWRVGDDPDAACSKCLAAIAAEANRNPGEVAVTFTSESTPN